jgi:hypothetical protein
MKGSSNGEQDKGERYFDKEPAPVVCPCVRCIENINEFPVLWRESHTAPFLVFLLAQPAEWNCSSKLPPGGYFSLQGLARTIQRN